MLVLQSLLWCIYSRNAAGLDGAAAEHKQAALVELPHEEGVDHRMLVTSVAHLGKGAESAERAEREGSAGKVLSNETAKDMGKVQKSCKGKVECESLGNGAAEIRQR